MKSLKGTIHHIEIYVSDLKQTKKFWSWVLNELGYEEYQQWEQGFSFILHDTYIVFVQTEEKFLKDGYHRCRTGLNHLAFCVDRRDDVDSFTEKLREKNIKILYEDKHPYAGGEDYYAVFFEDPDRIKVEIVSVI